MQRRRVGFSMAMIAVAALGRTVVAATATIYPLGFSDGSGASRGYAINASGQVAVTSTQLFGQGTAARFDGAAPGGTLRVLSPFAGFPYAAATAINSIGQVAGYTQTMSAAAGRAFRYDGTPGAGGVMRDLGTLGGVHSEASGVNDAGQVTGSADADPNGPTPGSFAFIYTGTPGAGGVMQSLGALGSAGSSGAAINNAGQVVGTSLSSVDGFSHAFRYDGASGTGTMRDLGLLSGFTSSRGAGINAGGQVVGALESADAERAFIFTGTPGVDGVMTELQTLGGGSIADAVAINDAGFVLGISDDADQTYLYPVLWRPDGSIVNLKTWLDAQNPALAQNWDLRNASVTGMSNTGLITGDGVYLGAGPDNGRNVAFILDASSLVPEPTGFALLNIALTSVLRRRARAR